MSDEEDRQGEVKGGGSRGRSEVGGKKREGREVERGGGGEHGWGELVVRGRGSGRRSERREKG